ncbi:putative methyltransferase-domain-containing protein [Chytriomyces sp. MP71]|nr:putative methyltransferase-domain-containing protein [Chytriomyces sp. MP71]
MRRLSSLLFHSSPHPPPAQAPLQVVISETLHDPPASHLWPSALALARYIWHNRSHLKQSCASRTVLELGCGTALPGLLAAKLSIGSSVLLTDSSCLDLVRDSVQLNALGSTASAHELLWGDFDRLEQFTDSLQDPIGVILCADVFYERVHFESLIATIAFLLQDSKERVSSRNPVQDLTDRAVALPYCILAYHERSSSRCIQHWLDKWGLVAESVPGDTFGFVDARVGPSANADLHSDSGSYAQPMVFGEGITMEGVAEGSTIATTRASFLSPFVFASNAIDLTPANFDKAIDGSKPALVEFYAPWYASYWYEGYIAKEVARVEKSIAANTNTPEKQDNFEIRRSVY